ncbi:hypothetical protein ACTWQL_03725 [Pseudalkalibacillus sp. R45]|uniref:hypothetical protein n=1 Tax=Pseudalkalibacillus sp. R45 TaxID=3457433 RepID=UPI003FCC94E2
MKKIIVWLFILLISVPITSNMEVYAQEREPSIRSLPFPVGRVLIKQSVPLLKYEHYNESGTIVRNINPGEGIRVYGKNEEYYAVGNHHYIKDERYKTAYYESRILIKETSPLFAPDGSIHRLLNVGEAIKVYGTYSGMYEVGGGYRVEINNRVKKYLGHIKPNYEIPLIAPDGSEYKMLQPGHVYRVYNYEEIPIVIDGIDYGSYFEFDLGGGYYVENNYRDRSYPFSYIKN